jgi:hypothetical protein
MRKILKNNKSTQKKLSKMKKLYLVVCWAKYTYIECFFSGKYEKNKQGDMIPLVYNYCDFNGVADLYILMKITNTTSGNIVMWTKSKSLASKIAEAMNKFTYGLWECTEKGCVITCSNCGERLEMCYPDGTEIRQLPYCPFCGTKMTNIKEYDNERPEQNT